MWLFDLIYAALFTTPVGLALLLLGGPVIGLRPFLIGLAHGGLALSLLIVRGAGASGVAVVRGGSSAPRECARMVALCAAAPALLSAQLFFGLGSLLQGRYAFMGRVRRLGWVVAALGLSLPVYGCCGPVETLVPSAAPR